MSGADSGVALDSVDRKVPLWMGARLCLRIVDDGWWSTYCKVSRSINLLNTLAFTRVLRLVVSKGFSFSVR